MGAAKVSSLSRHGLLQVKKPTVASRGPQVNFPSALLHASRWLTPVQRALCSGPHANAHMSLAPVDPWSSFSPPSPTAASICRRNCSMGPGPILRLPPPPKSPSFHHCGTTPRAPHRLRPPPPPLPSTTHPTPRPTHTLPGGTHPPPFSLPSFHPLPATGSGLFGEPHHSLWALRTWGKARPRPNLCFP